MSERAPQKHVWRARIVLVTADGYGTAEVVRRCGKSKPMVWRWQERFMAEGVDGLLRDKTRKPGKPPLPPATVAAGGRADAATAARRGDPLDRPDDGQGSRRQLALGAADLGGAPARAAPRPHLQAVEGPEVRRKGAGRLSASTSTRPPHAVVLSVDEKSQIQALDRTQPGLPMKPGRARDHDARLQTQRHDDAVRRPQHLDGTVIGRCMQRHRHQEFIRFLNADRGGGAGGQADPRRSWTTTPLTSTRRCGPGWRATRAGPSTSPRPRPRGSTPSRASSRSSPGDGCRRGVFASVVELQTAIHRYLAEANSADPKPFVWTADPDRIIDKVGEGRKRWCHSKVIKLKLNAAKRRSGLRSRGTCSFLSATFGRGRGRGTAPHYLPVVWRGGVNAAPMS